MKIKEKMRAAAMVTLGMVTAVVPALGQRLCEHNDNPVAKIAPCTGPIGTAITVTQVRTSVPSAQSLDFKRMVANATPAKVTVAVSAGIATAPPQLCINGPGRWEVWMADTTGISRGKIGAFWPDCNAAPIAPVGGGSGGGAGGGNGSGGAAGGGGGGGGGGGAGGGGAGSVDKCLIGTWVSGGVSGKMSGGSGLRITFKPNGTQIADYSGMGALTLNTLVYQFGGTSTGTVTTSNGTAKNSPSGGDATLSILIDGIGGEKKPTRGPALGMNKNNNNYTCSKTTLQFEQEDFKGDPWFKLTLTKAAQ